MKGVPFWSTVENKIKRVRSDLRTAWRAAHFFMTLTHFLEISTSWN